MKTKRVKKFFAIMLSVSMVMSTMNLTALADAIKSSDSTISLSEMISRSAEVKDDGSCEIALTIEAEDYEEMVQSDSDAEEKECTCEMIATDSNCTATDSNCEENGCTCGTAGKKSRSKNAYKYHDVEITDYTSKWVNLDTTSFKIWDGSTVIYEYDTEAGEYAWADGVEKLTSGKPVIYRVVDEADYNEDDLAVYGNEKNDIYEIIWNVKDGALTEEDCYKLTYSVKADTEEPGFSYDTEYPTNGMTVVSYKNAKGKTVEIELDELPVPVIEVSQNYDALGNTASKKSELVSRRENRYKINLSVPGEDVPDVHDEVIIMVDGSYSGDDEWPNTRKAIIEIGESVLDGAGNTQLTLMTFGMGDNIVLEQIKTVDELENQLTELPGGLLYGRSSTNCEAGFTGIQEYIEENEEDLNQVHVIYITDGEINTDETPYDFYQWKSNAWLKRDIRTLIQWSVEEELAYITYEQTPEDDELYGPYVPTVASEAFTTVFGTEVDYKNFNTSTVTDEQYIQWADLVWEDVYDEAGLTPGEEYPVSDVERAFVSYDKAHNTHVQEAWYYTLWGRSYPNRWTRTPEAATTLAAMDEVEHLYMVDTNGATSWMNPDNSDESSNNVVGENVSFTYNANVNNLAAKLADILSEIAKTQYNDVVITDYMSKWVNLDKDSIKVIDDSTGNAIYSSKEGWLIDEDERPVDSGVPVEIELVPEDEYDEDDAAVDGNTSGDIFKLTWKVKDGGLLRSDRYHLEYEVIVDTEEAGFVYGKDYPANGNTTVEYTDEKGTRNYDPIDVPDVNAEEPDPATAAKTDELIDRDTNKYRVTISVPGADGEKIHDEVILMVDGSYSLDDEWPAMKEAIVGIAEELLNGKGNTQLTLMAFGMGDNEVAVHVKSADEIAKVLGELPGTLLYGRSSTNCEAGLTGIGEYIDAHDESLNDVHVIYITDGNINTDETPYTFYNWTENTWLRYSKENIALWNLQGQCEAILDGLNPAEAFVEVFGADADAETVAATATAEQALEWANLVWADVYEAAGLNPETAYPVSDVERAFVAYDESCNTYVQDLFYYALVGRSYPERWTRTPAAANELAAKEEIESLYFVDYSGYTSWMDTGVTALNSEYIQANGIGNLLESMEDMITDLALMPYQDVVITDYMSKWVNLDTTTIKVVDDSTGTVIYSSEEGWKIDENRPTAQEVPVVVEKVDPADYAEGGTDVEGNTNGDIYKLTWYVKDGALLRSENYHLEYEVTVDTEEEGFNANTAYPANGDTTMEYTDEKGIEHEDPIAVPDVDVPKTEPNPTDPSESEPQNPTDPSESEPQNPTDSSESEPQSPTDPSESESQNPSQPSEPEGNEPTDNRNDDDNDNERGRVRGASDENEPETEGFTGAVLGAFDTFEILDDMIPLAVAPATGDLSLIWIALSILSALGLAGTSMIERKKRK